MAQLPSRESLEQMKRFELQKLCKEYGVKANLRNQELIEMLLNPRASPSPAPQPTRRSVSTKVSRQSSRAEPRRTNSIVIHGTDDEGEDDDDESHHREATCGEIRPIVVSVPGPRTRKAKELQTRLGVGRPVAAGGSGPRAVTKSVSIPRGKRGKSGKAMQPTEATIEEEPEAILESGQDLGGQNSPTLEQMPALQPVITEIPNTAAQIELETNIKNVMRPLQDSVDALKYEAREVEHLKAEVMQLKTKLASFDGLQTQVETLMAQVHELRAHADSANAVAVDFQQFKETWSYSRTPPNPASPQPKSPILPRPPGLGGLGFPSVIQRPSNTSVKDSFNSQHVLGKHVSDATAAHPGIAPSLLGKRHRDSLASNITGQEDESCKNEAVKEVVRPVKKRPKLSEDDTGRNEPEQLNPTTDDLQEIGQQAFAPRMRSFSVFQGPDELPESYLDPPPPTNQLPAFFAPSSPSEAESVSGPSVPNPRTTSSANALENHPHPFNFPFLPMSSTPASAMYLPNFSFPEPPASPSPVNTNIGGFFNAASSERTDMFKSFGLPPPIRPRSSGTVPPGLQKSEFVNPAALTRQASSGKQREASGSNAAISTSSNESDTARPVSEATGTKRTMYGTELDGDSRFGDFGMEGVANGFWAGARY